MGGAAQIGATAALLISMRPSSFAIAANAYRQAALAPAGPVRAVGVVGAVFAALTGRRGFAERLSVGQWLGGAAAALGVALAALG